LAERGVGEEEESTGNMDNFFVDGGDEIEELEPVDESESSEPREAEPASAFPEVPFLFEAGARSLIRSYEQTHEPLALLDPSLSFIFRNGPFKELLRAFAYPDARTLLGTLSKSIDPEMAKSIQEALESDEGEHAWKGIIAHRTKNAPAVITKVHIFPFYAEDDGRIRDKRKEKPGAYSVYLDDVTEENRKILKDMFSSLLEASKLKDNDTGKHIERVNLYSSIIAKELFNDSRWPEVDKDFIESIAFLAAMHDVGKIGIPDDILNKIGPLNEFEWRIMKAHTTNGAFILASYPNPMAREIALCHHELWNGSGYPFSR